MCLSTRHWWGIAVMSSDITLTERKMIGVLKLLILCPWNFFLADNQICYSYSYGVRAVVQCIPAWLRFIQCLRRYRDNKRAFHLVNAGKYSTTFFVVTFAALYSTHKGIGYFGKPFASHGIWFLHGRSSETLKRPIETWTFVFLAPVKHLSGKAKACLACKEYFKIFF